MMEALIALMMEAVSTSETLVDFYETTLCNMPEDSYPHTHHCENLKSHTLSVYITDKNHPLGLHWISEDTGIY
jgi:hypothetical protein